MVKQERVWTLASHDFRGILYSNLTKGIPITQSILLCAFSAHQLQVARNRWLGKAENFIE